MIIEAFVLSIIVGLLRRGSLRNLEKIPLRRTYLFVVAFVLAGAILAIIIRGGDPKLIKYARITNVAQYAVLLAAIGMNLHIREMYIAGLGTLMNAVVLTVNGGLMPVSKSAVEAAGLTSTIRNYAVRHVLFPDYKPRLAILSDIIPVRLFGYVSSQVISVGDVIVAVAVFLLIQHYMCAPGPSLAKEQLESA